MFIKTITHAYSCSYKVQCMFNLDQNYKLSINLTQRLQDNRDISSNPLIVIKVMHVQMIGMVNHNMRPALRNALNRERN